MNQKIIAMNMGLPGLLKSVERAQHFYSMPELKDKSPIYLGHKHCGSVSCELSLFFSSKGIQNEVVAPTDHSFIRLRQGREIFDGTYKQFLIDYRLFNAYVWTYTHEGYAYPISNETQNKVHEYLLDLRKYPAYLWADRDEFKSKMLDYSDRYLKFLDQLKLPFLTPSQSGARIDRVLARYKLA